MEFPYSVEEVFHTKSSVRVLGTLNGIDMDRALKPRGDGTHFIMVNTEMRKQAGLREGNMVSVTLYRNETPEKLVLPEELEEAFDQEPEARKLFDLQTTSMQRNIIYWINASKRAETRAVRSAEMLRRLCSGALIGGKKPQ